jgi:hypothetical protein
MLFVLVDDEGHPPLPIYSQPLRRLLRILLGGASFQLDTADVTGISMFRSPETKTREIKACDSGRMPYGVILVCSVAFRN